jgi:hypothetical protein
MNSMPTQWVAGYDAAFIPAAHAHAAQAVPTPRKRRTAANDPSVDRGFIT